MANEIVTQIVLEIDKLRADLKDAEKLGSDSGKVIGQGIGDSIEKSMSGAFSGIGTKLLGLASAALGAFTLKKMIDEASNADAAVQRFNSALIANNTFTNEASQHFQDYADHLQRITTFSNDAITSNAALLVSMGGLTGQGLERATKAALDLSAGMKIDLDTSFKLVAKAAEGNVAVLGRYGIRVRDTHNEVADFNEALKVIEARMGGMAEAQTQTFSGAMSQLGNNFNDVLKVLGQFATRSPLVIGVINLISSAFDSMVTSLKGLGGGDILGNFIRQILEVGSVITQYILPPFELLYNIGKDVFYIMATGVQALVTGLVTIVSDIVDIASLFTDQFNGVKESLKAFATDNEQILMDMGEKTAKTFTETFDFSFTQGTENILQKARDFTNNFGNALKPLADQAGPPTERMTEKMRQLQTAIQNTVNAQTLAVVSGGVQRLGASLIKGGDAFGDFKNFVLNALGDMSIKMGEAMIVQSAAFAALAALIANPFTSAGASLAFGLALVAIGGVLKAAAGGGAGAAAASAGGGVAAGGGSGLAPDNGIVSNAQVEDTRQRTNLVVNVQGNILDKKETGLYLADILQEVLLTNNVVTTT